MTFLKTKHFYASLLLVGSLLLTTRIQAETYTVKPGDTLSDIATAFHTTVDELAELNQIENKNLIKIGQVLQTNQAMTAATKQVMNSIAKTEAAAQAPTPVEAQTPQAPQTTEVQTPAQTPAQSPAPATPPSTVGNYVSNLSPEEAAAKEEIARRESGGSYTAQNGQYYGRYQLTISYLNGDLSPENQERVADAYVYGRYGSWVAALAHSNAYGWY